MASARVGVHNQQKLLKRKNKRRMLLSVSCLILTAGLLYGLSFLSFLPSLTIAEVAVSEEIPRSKDIASFIADRLAQNRAWFFSGKNSFLFARFKIKQAILESFPEMKDISFNLSGLTVLSVDGLLRTPSALWCDSAQGAECVSVDDMGLAFSSDSLDPERVIFYVNDSEPKAGGRVLPPDEFKNAFFFIQELKVLGLDPQSISVKSSSQMEISFHKGGKLIVDHTEDLSKVLLRIKALLSDKELGFGTAMFMEKLDYIDMRYGNKLVYRLKE